MVKLDNFKAVVVDLVNDQVELELKDVTLDNLDPGDVLIEVAYASINYKDMLAYQTKGGVIREYPMIPGIDFTGIVVSDQSGQFEKGQKVIVSGYDEGVSHTGGHAEYARVKAEWVEPLPEGLSMKEAIIYGTAGYTAAQSVQALEKFGMSVADQPRILVTGSSGGVGSISLAILAKLGYNNITALIRKDYQEDLVKKLGAQNILWADDIGEKKPLGSRKYDYIVDTVGGDVAATLLSQINDNGAMTMCGNAGGVDFNTTVLPIILRGVNILGINSLNEDPQDRYEIWRLLANEWNVSDKLHYQTIQLPDVAQTVADIKNGAHLGRTIIKVKAE